VFATAAACTTRATRGRSRDPQRRGLDYALLHYYIGCDDQERQLADVGFELLECLDLEARPVEAGQTGTVRSFTTWPANGKDC
jgi:hypothetical protein